MFRAKFLIPFLLFLAYLTLEVAYFAGKRLAPAYPDLRTAELGDQRSITSGRITYHLYPVDAYAAGTLCVNFFAKLGGSTDKLPKLRYGILSPEENEVLVRAESTSINFQKYLSRCVAQELGVFKRRSFFMLRQRVPAAGRYYLLVANPLPTKLSGEQLFFFVTNFREKAKCFWPYALLFIRNLVILCLVVFFAFKFYGKVKRLWRFLVVLAACGIVSFILCATPLGVVRSAMGGPRSRVLYSQKVGKDLAGEGDVLKIPLDNCPPYGAALLNVKGRALDSAAHALVYTDLYKAPSYDDPQTEALLTFSGPKEQRYLLAFDTVHSFSSEVSLRFWNEGHGGPARIEEVTLEAASLPPIVLKVILGFAQFLLPCFWVVWAGLLVSFYFVAVYFRRDIYSKIAAALLTLAALAILVAPVYSFGYPEPLAQTTDERWIMGLRPMSFYSLLWRNEPKPDITPAELENPVAGSLTVASYSDHVLAARGELYPDNNKTFQRFFTRFFSNIRMSIRREMVVLRDLRLVRLNGAYLMLRMIAWLWLMALILGSLFQAFRVVFKGGKA